MITEPLDLRPRACGRRSTMGRNARRFRHRARALPRRCNPRSRSVLSSSALGFDKTAWTYPGALFLSAGGYHHHVGTNIWAAGSPAQRRQTTHGCSSGVVNPTAADVDAVAANATASGFGVGQDGTETGCSLTHGDYGANSPPENGRDEQGES
jgi:hypothetical protein